MMTEEEFMDLASKGQIVPLCQPEDDQRIIDTFNRVENVDDLPQEGLTVDKIQRAFRLGPYREKLPGAR
jgi:hypothetical protein